MSEISLYSRMEHTVGELGRKFLCDCHNPAGFSAIGLPTNDQRILAGVQGRISPWGRTYNWRQRNTEQYRKNPFI